MCSQDMPRLAPSCRSEKNWDVKFPETNVLANCLLWHFNWNLLFGKYSCHLNQDFLGLFCFQLVAQLHVGISDVAAAVKSSGQMLPSPTCLPGTLIDINRCRGLTSRVSAFLFMKASTGHQNLLKMKSIIFLLLSWRISLLSKRVVKGDQAPVARRGSILAFSQVLGHMLWSKHSHVPRIFEDCLPELFY